MSPDRYVVFANEQWNGKRFWTVRDQVRDCTVKTTRSERLAREVAAVLNFDARMEDPTHAA